MPNGLQMMNRVILLFVLLSFAPVRSEDALPGYEQKYLKSVERIKSAYRNDVADYLKNKATKIEIIDWAVWSRSLT